MAEMSSQLNDAIQFAQAGQREEARRLLWQVVRQEPNNEAAWLWLASVAADQEEYRQALTEALRINPTNTQAQQMMALLQASQPAPPPVSTPVPGPSGQPPMMTTPPPPQPGASGIFPKRNVPTSGYVSTPGVSPFAIQQPRQRGGCCTQNCLILLIVFVVLPALICGAVSYTGYTVGPGDMIAGYLPGEFGRKTVEFDVESYTVSVDVPRSWVPALKDNIWWDMYSAMLDAAMPLEGSIKWEDLAIDEDAIDYQGYQLWEVNPVTLAANGAPSFMAFLAIGSGDYRCEYVESHTDLADDLGDVGTFDVTELDNVNIDILEQDGGLCGVRVDGTMRTSSEKFFERVDAPDEMRIITLMLPVDEDLGTIWTIYLPEDEYDRHKDNIKKIIETVEVKRK
jgi:hypothetical protein